MFVDKLDPSTAITGEPAIVGVVESTPVIFPPETEITTEEEAMLSFKTPSDVIVTAEADSALIIPVDAPLCVTLACAYTAAFADVDPPVTVNRPVTNAPIAVSEIRLRIVVFVDIFFLSLVKTRYFLVLARRSFDLLIPFPMAHTCNAARYGNLFIRWALGHHLLDLIPEALESQSQVDLKKAACDLHNLG